ncbi:hypothetical protein ACS5PN_31095 [Roseateles sp. NT4]|uniref:hypothetical protein n=1 Tax=Roseateles sp. NT4 TaxID=3453715 RepID=UPI003EEA21B1
MTSFDFMRRLRTLAMLLVVTACGGGGGGPSTPPPPSPPSLPSPPPSPPPVQATAPSITAAPAALSVDDGAAASFSVTAQGTGPLSYQWSRNGAAIAGATSATLLLPAVQLADQGAQFSVVVSNAAGSVTSVAATLSVRAIAITLQADLAPLTPAEAGSSRSFSIEARGSQPLSIQWLRDGAPIAGATSATYTTAALHYGDDGTRITAHVSNAAGTVLSQASRIAIAVKTAQPIATCQEITQPGVYTLTRDVAATSNDGKPCIDIHDTHDVLLDCADHEIANTLQLYVHALHITNAERIALRRCRIRADWNELSKLRDVSITDNVIKAGDPSKPSIVNVRHAERLRFDNNQLAGSYQQIYTTDSTLSNNQVKTVPNEVVPALLILNYGSGNRVLGNQLDGSWNPANTSWNGADDGILLGDELAAVVKNNQIRDVWDCGIEWVGTVKNAVIQGNRITHAAYCGIGGWYFSSVRDSQFLDNVVERTNQLFSIFRAYCLRPVAFDDDKLMPADDGIRFENNRFENNSLKVDANTPLTMASYFNFDFPFGEQSACTKTLGDKLPQPADLHLGNNVFKNNDFGVQQQSPYFSQSLKGAIVDGGGNVCTATTDAAYPLKCNPPPKP